MKLELKHLSPSTINSFIENKPSFRANKVLGRPFFATPSMCRGKAVEHVINEWIKGKEYIPDQLNEHISVVALENYDMELAPFAAEFPEYNRDTDEIRNSVARCAIKAYQVYTEDVFPVERPFTQTKVEVNLPEVTRVLKCYLDFYLHGRKVHDCKVLGRNQSKLAQGYQIQGAVYRFGTGCPVNFDLIVPQKKEVKHNQHALSDGEYKFGLSYATQAAKAIEALIDEEDPDKVFRLMSFPNLSQVWNPDEKKKLCDEWEIVAPVGLYESEEE